MPDSSPPDRSAHARRAAPAIAGLLTLAVACTTSQPIPAGPQPTTESVTSSPQPAKSPTETTSPSPPAQTHTPQAAAIQWLAAYRSATWTDPRPSAWIDRVRPYVTDTMNTTNETLRDMTAGTDWSTFVARHCTSAVTDAHALIPAESPGTDTAANVQVTGTVRTSCAAGTPDHPAEQTSATLLIVRTNRGWQVDQRMF